MTALGHLTVIELAEGVAGEYCGKLVADFGATVVKVERPGTGSPTRAMGPFGKGVAAPEASGLFAYLNAGKRSVTLDLAGEEGRATLARLVARADAVIDDHPPGWLAMVGLDPATVREAYPSLVLCAITPFGQDAPDDRAHAEDLTVLHASGWGFHTPTAADPARPPLKGAGRFLPSYEAGLEGALCIAACLHDTARGGPGRIVDISAQAVMASRIDYVLGQMVAGDMDVGPERSRFDLGGPAGIFPCRDGFVYVFMSTAAHWRGFLQLVGEPEELVAFPPDWLERGLTDERVAGARAHLVRWLAGVGKDEAAALAQDRGVTLVPVNLADDLPRSAQLAHRGFFAEMAHPAIGRLLHPTVPYRLSRTPAAVPGPAPRLGADDGLAA